MFQNWIARNRFNWISKMLSKYAGEPILTAVNQQTNQLHSNQGFPIPSDEPYYSILTQFDLIMDARTDAGPFQLRFSSI